MTFLPVVGREMNVLARRKGFYWTRTATALASLVALGWFLAITASTSFLSLGRSIFSVLSWLGLLYAMVAGIHATSDCVSEEKREGTLGLLFLTNLKGYDVILGKVSATSLSGVYALLAIVPMISLGLLLGGVTFREIGQVAGILANTLFLSLSLGVFISTLSTNERRSLFAAAVILFLLTVVPFALVFSGGGFASFTLFRYGLENIAWLSPVYPMLVLQFQTALPFGFVGTHWMQSMLLHHILAWSFLLLSWGILPRFIHDLPRRRRGSSATESARELSPARKRRRAYRNTLLDKNAFLWLALRQPGKPAYAWFLVLFFTGLYGWVAWYFPNLAHDVAINLVIWITLHFTLKLWVTSEVCQRLVEDRRAGALELLLSTPITVNEIARGQALALWRIFASPVLVLVCAELALANLAFHSGLQRPGPGDRAFTIFSFTTSLLVDLWALNWVGQWRSLCSKTIERALAGTLATVLGIPWVASITFYGVATMLANFRRDEISYRACVLAWWTISLFWSFGYGWLARRRFLESFRERAANRFELQPEGRATTSRHSTPQASFSETGALSRKDWRVTRGFRNYPATSALLLGIFLICALVFGRKAYWRYQLWSEVRRVQRGGHPTNFREASGYFPGSLPGRDAYPVFAAIPAPHHSDFNTWHAASAGNSNGNINGIRFPAAVTDFTDLLRANATCLETLRSITNCAFLKLPFTNQLNFNLYGALGCIDYVDAATQQEPERAYADMMGLASLLRLLRHCPFESAQGFVQPILTSTMRVLQSHPILNEHQLASLIQSVEKIDSTSVFPESLRLMRAFVLDANSVPLRYSDAEALPAFVENLLRLSGTYDKQRVQIARMTDSWIEVSAQSYPDRLFAKPHVATYSQWDVSEAMRRDAEVSAHIAVLEAGLALQRARFKQRTIATLTELVPDYLPAVPLDPFTGEPLKFSDKGTGWEVYSLGRNRTDDAKSIHHFRSDLGDIVFVVR